MIRADMRLLMPSIEGLPRFKNVLNESGGDCYKDPDQRNVTPLVALTHGKQLLVKRYKKRSIRNTFKPVSHDSARSFVAGRSLCLSCVLCIGNIRAQPFGNHSSFEAWG